VRPSHARSLANWALLPALSGFSCDVDRKVLRFAPAVAADHFRTLFTCGSGWGSYTQSMDDEHTMRPRITVLGGNLDGFAIEGGGPPEHPARRGAGAAAFSCVFSTGTSCGRCRQERAADTMRWELTIEEDSLPLRSVVLQVPWEQPAGFAEVAVGGEIYSPHLTMHEHGDTIVHWHSALVVPARETIAICLRQF
jgi:hypothetical protein